LVAARKYERVGSGAKAPGVAHPHRTVVLRRAALGGSYFAFDGGPMNSILSQCVRQAKSLLQGIKPPSEFRRYVLSTSLLDNRTPAIFGIGNYRHREANRNTSTRSQLFKNNPIQLNARNLLLSHSKISLARALALGWAWRHARPA